MADTVMEYVSFSDHPACRRKWARRTPRVRQTASRDSKNRVRRFRVAVDLSENEIRAMGEFAAMVSDAEGVVIPVGRLLAIAGLAWMGIRQEFPVSKSPRWAKWGQRFIASGPVNERDRLLMKGKMEERLRAEDVRLEDL